VRLQIQFSNSHRSDRHCERSEAIHSSFPRRDGWLRAARNDGWKTQLRDLAACFARVLLSIPAPERSEGAGKPGARSTRSLACEIKSTRVSHHGHTGITRHSPRNGFNAYSALSPVSGFFATVACASYRRLDSSTAKSGPHALAVREDSAFVFGAARVHRIPSRGRDDRVSPLCGTGPNRYSADFTWPSSEISVFPKWDRITK
jgi:hypothetical protein